MSPRKSIFRLIVYWRKDREELQLIIISPGCLRIDYLPTLVTACFPSLSTSSFRTMSYDLQPNAGKIWHPFDVVSMTVPTGNSSPTLIWPVTTLGTTHLIAVRRSE